MRDTPYPYTSTQLFHKLLAGVQLPPPGADLSGIQRSLLLTPQQIADNQQSPPFSAQFPANSITNAAPVFFWWLAVGALGWLTFVVTFSLFHALADRGYIFSKTLGVLLLAYLTWLLASVHVLAFSRFSLLFVVSLMILCAVFMFIWQRQKIVPFLRQRWRFVLLEEGIFTLAFLLFVGIRSLDPDLWNIFMGGEKPMELAFLHAVLRSSYMPPYDPWFAGGYINYYYYGYVIVGALIKLTAIVPTTAFNLAIPTLFALTFTGVVSLVYSLTRHLGVALLGGYFATIIGNFDGVVQLKAQVVAALAHIPVPMFDYWRSSRVIPFTINEFPFWSFLFADLHPHVIDLPIAVLMLGIVAALFLPGGEESMSDAAQRRRTLCLYLLAAFVLGTIACVNTWDMPVYAVLLAAALIIRTILAKRLAAKLEMCIALGFCLVTVGLLYALGYLFYWPFYASYQQLYVNGLGLVAQGSTLTDYLTIFCLWIFLALSFLLLELYRWLVARGSVLPEMRRRAGYVLLCGVALIFITLLGLKTLLLALTLLAAFLFIVWGIDGGVPFKSFKPVMLPIQRPRTAPTAVQLDFTALRTSKATTRFLYVMLLLGLCITLGQEIVYVRDFLDGSDYFRMNSVFKFSMQAWLCFAIGGALVVQHVYRHLGGFLRRAWLLSFILLVLACSVFPFEGTVARISDHQGWVMLDGEHPVTSANYIPTLDGFAFAHAWYPGDAQAITWLNDHVSGSPVVLEAAAPVSYQWFNRVSVYTGLPDVLGWPDHVSEQRYAEQSLNRVTDIAIIYTTSDAALAIELLRYYHVHYIYIGPLEQQTYGQQSPNGLSKFDRMVGEVLRIVYRAKGVSIYEML